jgi:predicted dithiol-disulfide oxidoreductase (DUF899 family)
MTVTDQTTPHRVVSEQEWIEARTALLKKEKELTRQRDEISRLRQELPWVKVEKNYTFDSPEGRVSLTDLFDGRSQLIVYHFMFAPDWEQGCDGCSFICDHVDAARQHFEHHDVSFVAVSRATVEKLEAYKKRMGWKFRWVSSGESDFNYDYHASYRREDLDRGPVFHNFTVQKLNGEDQPGLSAFIKDANGDIYHTYSTYERGGDILIGAYNYLDMAPLGRNEQGAMDWMKRHDEYEGDR